MFAAMVICNVLRLWRRMYKCHLILGGLVVSASSHRKNEGWCGERDWIIGDYRWWLIVTASAHEKRFKEDKVLKRSGDDVEVWS